MPFPSRDAESSSAADGWPGASVGRRAYGGCPSAQLAAMRSLSSTARLAMAAASHTRHGPPLPAAMQLLGCRHLERGMTDRKTYELRIGCSRPPLVHGSTDRVLSRPHDPTSSTMPATSCRTQFRLLLHVAPQRINPVDVGRTVVASRLPHLGDDAASARAKLQPVEMEEP